jgi:hypothetical protein
MHVTDANMHVTVPTCDFAKITCQHVGRVLHTCCKTPTCMLQNFNMAFQTSEHACYRYEHQCYRYEHMHGKFLHIMFQRLQVPTCMLTSVTCMLDVNMMLYRYEHACYRYEHACYRCEHGKISVYLSPQKREHHRHPTVPTHETRQIPTHNTLVCASRTNNTYTFHALPRKILCQAGTSPKSHCPPAPAW